ncbi:hypothetical protein BC937DRAFT_87190 [Endogone sp. FLAS-F59071]|nr:hypothetical protein BC937DRAFT_87190 [Endogone sp. FLAS-F59071]|eukprot:RUS19623.1 hypothetical protein BC937DRAFT_87190 [Endogone sp. FLAS-F59071]
MCELRWIIKHEHKRRETLRAFLLLFSRRRRHAEFKARTYTLTSFTGSTFFSRLFGLSPVVFERYGRLVRCDIPARTYNTRPYAFIEFENSRDAEDAFDEMHGRDVDGYTLDVQWAKNTSSNHLRYEHSPPRRRRTSTPPPVSRRSYRSRSRSPSRGQSRSLERHYEDDRVPFKATGSPSPVDHGDDESSESPYKEAKVVHMIKREKDGL